MRATQLQEERLRQAVAASLRVGLPQLTSTRTVTETATEQSGAAPTVQGTETQGESRQAGQAPAAPAAPPGSATPPATGLPADFQPSTEPRLHYQVADALFQEVQLLNRRVVDAARRDGYVPFIVGMRVSTMPYRRDLGADVYADIGFFSSPNREPAKDPGIAADVPLVVPLLVTDAIETRLAGRAAEQASQFGAAVTGTYANIGAAADASVARSNIERLVGVDYNSVFTVTRLTDNILRVRLGALQQGQSRYALVPQTHALTLLLLVPEIGLLTQPRPTISVEARTWLRDALSGASVPKMDGKADLSDLQRRLDGARESCSQGPAISIERVQELLNEVNQADYLAFLKLAHTYCGDHVNPMALWTELAPLTAGYGTISASFELPWAPAQLPAARTMALAVDNGTDATTVWLAGGRGLDPGGLQAALRLNTGAAKGASLPATKVVVDDHGLTAEFPSLAALGLNAAGAALELDAGARGRAAYPLAYQR